MAAWGWLAALIAASVGLFALITWTDDRSDAALHARSHAFAQAAGRICRQTASELRPVSSSRAWRARAASALTRAGAEVAALPEPPNVHRALARVLFDWRRASATLRTHGPASSVYRRTRKQATLAAHLLDVTACTKVLPA